MGCGVDAALGYAVMGLCCAATAARLGKAGLLKLCCATTATAWLGRAGLGCHWVAAKLCSGADAGLSWAEVLILGCDATTDVSLSYDLGSFHSPNHGENMEFEKWY